MQFIYIGIYSDDYYAPKAIVLLHGNIFPLSTDSFPAQWFESLNSCFFTIYILVNFFSITGR